MEMSRFAAAVRDSWRLIISCAFAAGAIALLVSAWMPRQYNAEARVLVGSLTDPNYDQILAYQQLAQTYAQLATTTPVLIRVRDDLGLRDDVKHLAARVDARTALGQSTVRVIASASTAAAAAQLANAVAAEVARMAQPAAGQPSLATIVQPAVPPDSPSAPLVLLNSLIAAVLGLALGIGLALIPDRWLRALRWVTDGAAGSIDRVRVRVAPTTGLRGRWLRRESPPLSAAPSAGAAADIAPRATSTDASAAAPPDPAGARKASGSHRRARSTIGTDPLDAPGGVDTHLVWDSAFQDLETGRPGHPR